MTLSEILQGVTVTKIFQTLYGKMVVTHDVKVSGVQYDSRKVEKENMFVAVRGAESDGHKFLSSAIAQGAKVIVIEDDNAIPDALCMHTGVVKVVVPNTRKALAVISANYYGNPARQMTIIGVTGTNGKTTTTFLIKQMIESRPEYVVGLIGTVEYEVGNEIIPATHTTPESLELHQLFAHMREQGCTHVVMEVSSHALLQYRVFGIPFAVAVFTNLTQDHLDYHGTMEEYFKAKKILFDSLTEKAVAVVNGDSEYGKKIVEGIKAPVVSYSIHNASDAKAEHVSLSVAGFSATINKTEVQTSLVGKFNIYNFLAAYSAVNALGITVSEKVFKNLRTAPGRFEQIQSLHGWTAIIDYAHTPDALENCLQTIRDTLPGDKRRSVITVFGAGGNRDKTKRPLMGTIAEKLSDKIIITSDNPRMEDPKAIIEDILAGVSDKEKAVCEPDRAKAIVRGLQAAKDGDIVLIAGKGHEKYQIIGNKKQHFDDCEEVRKYMQQ
ncbi:MAG: UDP-N-acetylmuramoyl-L-alanyl-D-glutamate--2,6-diaminopimelate ligase [Bacteroidetes bacterium]|nr:UDP-N-acetylmuramoyl-L-alanyl-D-glutamate--2,6-diaminopimelate ligase [Bacteroidota bacterium]